MVLETTVIKICVPTVGSQAISTRANFWLVLQSSIVLSTFWKLYLADASRLLGKCPGGIPIQEWVLSPNSLQAPETGI